MEIPKSLINCLTEKNVRYQMLHHPEAFTAQTIAEAEHVKVQADSGSARHRPSSC